MEVKYKLVNGEYIQLTEEEIKQREEAQKKQELEYTVEEDKPTQSEINFAEYVLETEDRIQNLQNEINILKGSAV